jgi:hypothetical protein
VTNYRAGQEWRQRVLTRGELAALQDRYRKHAARIVGECIDDAKRI